MTRVLEPDLERSSVRRPHPATTPDDARARRARQLGPRPHAGPGVGASDAAAPARRHRRALPLGSRRLGLGEHLLLRRGAGGHQELEGVLLRLLRLVELRDRRQGTGVALGDGPLGPALRRQRLEHPRPPGARRRRDRGCAVPRGPSLVLRRFRVARGRGARADPGRRADVPLQQPRRAARAVSRRWRVRDDPLARTRAARGGSCSRSRWSGSASSPRCCRPCSSSPRSGSSTSSPRRCRCAAASCSSRWRALRCSRRRAGGSPIVELWPAASRPYIGGSQGNSVLELIFGYNGFGRLTGNETGSVGGGGGQGGRWGPTGLTRMFGTEFGTQISWLLPAALILLVAGLAWRGRLPRTDRVRAAFILWGGWLLVTGITFSLGKGIIHPYYAIALAPAIGALVGMGAGMLWKRRHDAKARAVLAGVVATTTIWTFVLLGRTPDWSPWLRGPLLLAGIVVAGALLGAHLVHGRALVVARARRRRRAPGRARGLHALHRPPRAQRRDPDGRPREHQRLRVPRRRTPGRGRCRARGRATHRRRLPRCRRRDSAVEPAGCSTAAPRAPSSPTSSAPTAGPSRGSPRPSAPTRPRATSSPPATRSWPSAGSTAPIPPRRWPSSRPTCSTAGSTTSSAEGAASGRRRARRHDREHVVADPVVGQRQLLQPGPSAASPCTTSPRRRPDPSRSLPKSCQ